MVIFGATTRPHGADSSVFSSLERSFLPASRHVVYSGSSVLRHRFLGKRHTACSEVWTSWIGPFLDNLLLSSWMAREWVSQWRRLPLISCSQIIRL